MFDTSPQSPTETGWAPGLLLAALAFVVSASHVNHGLIDSPLPAGPGLTTDESINIRQGLYLYDAFTQHGPEILLPGTAQEVYSDPAYLPDYVPLGRLCIGAAHAFTAWIISGAELSLVNVPAARLASSVALAMTVLLMVRFTTRHYGSRVAVTAVVLLLLMPRVIGHSRLACLETLTMLAWFAALWPLLNWWTADRPPTSFQAIISGLLWGLLMLVKIQGVLLPPVIALFALVRFLHHGLKPLSLMAITGLLVFFLGWPWLWLDPVKNVSSYLMSTTDRPTIYNWYLGERYTDVATPWHYPFVMLALTIPLHTAVCLLLRFGLRKWDAAEKLMALSVIVPLIVFALPGTPVYDGTRLFLFVAPAAAILGARGLWMFADAVRRRASGSGTNYWGWILWPVCVLMTIDAALTIPQLGAFAGDAWNNAVRFGRFAEHSVEASYWGDALNGDFWDQVPQGATVAVAPVLHPVLLQDMMTMVPVIQQKEIRLEPFFYNPQEQRGLILLIHRLAELRPVLREPPNGTSPLVEVRQDQRVLARLVDTTSETWPEVPQWD